jgi:hypothetical protein
MTVGAKRKILILVGLTTILMFTIAGGLSQLDPGPGTPFPFGEDLSSGSQSETAFASSITVSALARAILLIVLGLATAYVAYLMLRAAPIKDVLRAVLTAAGIGVAVLAVLLLFSLVRVPVTLTPDETEISPPPAEVSDTQPGDLPAGFIWLAGAVLFLAIILVVYQFIRGRDNLHDTRDPLALEAEQALKNLRMGLDLKNVVLACYQQMSLILQKEQGINRLEAMTAREFEQLLEARGIPYSPVHKLTQLFEAARYGNHATRPGDEQNAIDCLSDIVRYARSPKD